MTFDMILARSFSKGDQKRFGYGAIFLCFIVVLSFSTALNPYLGPLPSFNLTLSIGDGLKVLMIKEERFSHEQEEIVTVEENMTKKVEPLCTLDRKSDFCAINGDIRVHANSSSVLIASTFQTETSANRSWAIRPYARKRDSQAMSHVREWTVAASAGHLNLPRCMHNHSVPAILFSTGGYSGNTFHAFSDIIVPLYLTSRKFNREVQFLVTDINPWWINKFRVILENLSRYEPIDIDTEQDVLCFPEITVGLVHHKELTIDPSRSPYSMKDFREFLRSSYSLRKSNAIKMTRDGRNKRPRLLIVSRKRTRSFVNEPEIVRTAESLGYEVILAEPGPNTTRNAEIVSSCDVMMGVHGAGLTNLLFLPENAVLIQIIPLGGVEWHGKVCFGDPAKRMNISYLEYRIKVQESSLIHEYPIDHVVLKDPTSFHKERWDVFKSVYLEKQNVELDLNRFRGTLLQAMDLLHV